MSLHKNPTKTQAWQRLQDHFDNLRAATISDLNKRNDAFVPQFNIETPIGTFNFAKNNISSETTTFFDQLFDETDLNHAIEKQFNGGIINHTENRAVLHSALRSKSSAPLLVNGENVRPKIQAVFSQMKLFSQKLRSGQWKGFTGETIQDIVNIGIGGSDLGPKMAYEALQAFKPKNINVHFVSNIDGVDLQETLCKIRPETTLFVIASKTFSTQETLTNANSAKKWFLAAAEENQMKKHFIAVSANPENVAHFGIIEENRFTFWNWVGGRYSIWSSISLSLCLAIGFENFTQFLDGAHFMDQHFKTEPTSKNVPKMMALLGIWYRNFFNYSTHAVLPYSHNLKWLPAYLQQADMESNGKSIDRNGHFINYKTGPVIWGQPGTNGQHAFYQLMHQGKEVVPADFIGFCKIHGTLDQHHDKLMANFFAQPEALMKGKSKEEAYAELKKQGLTEEQIQALIPYKVFEGNKPSNSFLLKELNPYTLGALLAAYEHKIFVQGVIWNLNSFDQWGVELGKQMAGSILPELNIGQKVNSHDCSTNQLINYYNASKKSEKLIEV